MSDGAGDSAPISTDDSHGDPSERALRQYRTARRVGDDQRAVELWEEFVLLHYDLMRNKIARLVGRRALKHLLLADIDDVAQEAFLRAQGMALTFDSATVGQARAALVRTAEFAALDHQRRRESRERDVAGSLDETKAFDDGSSVSRFEQHVAGNRDSTNQQVEDALELEAIRAAIDALPNADQRAVLLLTWDGFESKEIASRIDKGVNNVDQLRRRGMTKLKETLTHA